MVELIEGSTASANAEIGSVSDSSVGTYVFELVDGGSFTGTVKVAARILGRAKSEGATGFPSFLAITNRTTGAVASGATGITAAGMYSVDLTGCEARLEVTRTAGTYSVYGIPLVG